MYNPKRAEQKYCGYPTAVYRKGKMQLRETERRGTRGGNSNNNGKIGDYCRFTIAVAVNATTAHKASAPCVS